ncbi:MAG: hypothetical protein MUP41_12645 [Desulfobacterales bacterium]|jgi:hypothetical protein|nr:hypothetical protein [Desulfobacterales bacterium]
MASKKASLSFEDYVRGIKGLKPEEQLSLVEIISARLKIILKKKKVKHSILELEGLGVDIWKGIDAQQYVRNEREAWDYELLKK